MAEVVQEILFCLLVAAAIGVAIGWLLHGLRSGKTVAAVETAQRELGRVRTRLASTELALSAAGREHERSLEKARAETEKARAQVKSARTAEAEQAREASRRPSGSLAQPIPPPGERGLPKPPPSGSTQQQLHTLRATLGAAESGWDTARAQAEAAMQQLQYVHRQLDELETARATLAAQLAEARALLARRAAEPPPRPAAPAPPPEPPPRAPTPPPEPRPQAARETRRRPPADDLQRIRGIGPVLERRLHRMGVYRYQQIAGWTRQDIAAVAEQLPGFRDRIVRDRWTAAARRLHIEKYGKPPA